jgi:hypothetical protein
MKLSLLSYRSIVAVCLGAIVTPSSAQLEFVSRTTVTPSDNWFGDSVALSPSYVVIGEPRSDEVAANAGTVSVFSAKTGAYQRLLKASDGASLDRFGSAVAVSGSRILVGAPSANGNVGAVYVFDAVTGRQLRKLVDLSGVASDFFGGAVALHGQLALIGAQGSNTGVAGSTGAAFLFDINTGTQLAKLVPSDGDSGMQFGSCVSLNGSLAVVGAWASGGGAAYVFDSVGHTQLRKLVAADGAAGDRFGSRVSVFGNSVLVGAPFDDGGRGSAYLFSVSTGLQLRKFTLPVGAASTSDLFGSGIALSEDVAVVGIPGYGEAISYDLRSGQVVGSLTPPSTDSSVNFGGAIAISGNQVLVAASLDDSRASNAGKVYLFQERTTVRPLSAVAAKGELAPEAGGAKYGTLSAPVINNLRDVAYLSTLSGAGTANFGVWAQRIGVHRLQARVGSDIGGALFKTGRSPVFNDDGDMIFSGTVSGPGITSANDTALFVGAPLGSTRLLSENVVYGGGFLGGTAINSFQEVVQDYDGSGALACVVKRKSAPGAPVNATNDSGAVFYVPSVDQLVGIGEKEVMPAGSDIRYGEITPRISLMKKAIAWGATLVPGTATPPGVLNSSTNRALFWKRDITSPGLVARAGDEASVGVKYSSFVAISLSHDIQSTFKTTLSGTGVNSTNNEGIYRAGLGQVWRKGEALNATDYPGVTISRVLRFWSLRHGQVILLAQIKGTKVTAANDLALILVNPADRNHVLLREGDFAEGADGAKILTIQRVDVEPVGSQYVVIASLTGSTATNQALFTGRTTGVDQLPINPRLARAGMKLRKGTAYDTGTIAVPSGKPIKPSSLSIATSTDVAGAGGKGLGQTIEPLGSVGLMIDYSNGLREIRKGVP